ncbi:MAG: PQQ-dependent sugar dehydrogenase [Epibacterium sp.]|nr:PQQ-dependent sugar dehydrogenase [Epibacterium sp.]NQX72123.1 PQQ-dependent sugar dehydrogenase [Epibacterium sp.]
MTTSLGEAELETKVGGLDVPWGFAFVPGGGVLITERKGNLLYSENGQTHPVSGIDRLSGMEVAGQGGLLDILVPRDFGITREVFLTYSKRQGLGAGTAVAKGRLSEDARRISDIREIFEATPSASGGRHFGSRIVEAPDGTLFVTLGERGDRASAQDLSREQGSIIRIHRDGSIPADNPFVGTPSAKPAIWSLGHRNPQGMAVDARGQIWAVEHGARGGDEVNKITKGANYGWPVISFGRHYSGLKIGEGTHKAGMEQPKWYWDPSMAPSGMLIYSGKLWPEWRGDMFIGSLKFDYISRLSGQNLKEVEQLKSEATGRVRDLREAPDGSIWFASEQQGALIRMTPK